MRRFEVTVDAAFAQVVLGCSDPGRPHGWISREIRDAYVRLHRLGWAHSVEAWTPDGTLAGGLYGVAIGGLFAGESMFSAQRDASKVALVHLVDLLRADRRPHRVLDVSGRRRTCNRLGAVRSRARSTWACSPVLWSCRFPRRSPSAASSAEAADEVRAAASVVDVDAPTYSWPRIPHHAGTSDAAAASSASTAIDLADGDLAQVPRQLDDRHRAAAPQRVDDELSTLDS